MTGPFCICAHSAFIQHMCLHDVSCHGTKTPRVPDADKTKIHTHATLKRLTAHFTCTMTCRFESIHNDLTMLGLTSARQLLLPYTPAHALSAGCCFSCPAGLLAVMPDAQRCIAAHAEHMQHQLERMRHSSSSASRQAAKPLTNMLSVGLVLTYIWAECVHISTSKSGSIKPHPNIKSVTQAVSGGSHFCTAAATITASWNCDTVLQACMTAANKTSKPPTTERASMLLALSFVRAESLVNTCAGVDCGSLKHTKPMPAASDQGWDAVLRVVSGFSGLRVAHAHSAQQGKPSAAAATARGSSSRGSRRSVQDSTSAAPAAVPSHHNALLQVVGLEPKQLQDVIADIKEPGLPVCLDAVNWALHQLHDHLKDQGPAQQQGQQASTTRRNHPGPVSSAASNPSTDAPTPWPGAAASMRLLPPLLLLLAELAALQPEAYGSSTYVLDSVLAASNMCMAITKLPAAAGAQQASSGSSLSPSAAVLQGVFHACLELLPLQQQLAASRCRTSPGAAAAESASSPWDSHRLLASVSSLLGNPAAGAAPRLMPWERQLFRMLGDSMVACASQQGELLMRCASCAPKRFECAHMNPAPRYNPMHAHAGFFGWC